MVGKGSGGQDVLKDGVQDLCRKQLDRILGKGIC